MKVWSKGLGKTELVMDFEGYEVEREKPSKEADEEKPELVSIKGVIRGWQFPKPEGGKVIIAKQFTFKKKI